MANTPFKLKSGNKSPLEYKQMGSSPAKIAPMMIAEIAKMAGKQQAAEIEYTKHASDRVMAGISGRQGQWDLNQEKNRSFLRQ